MEIEQEALEGEVLPDNKSTPTALRVRSFPRGFTSTTKTGDVHEGSVDSLGEIWVIVHWDGETPDTKLYLLGRDVEPI